MTDNSVDRAAFKRMGEKSGCSVPGCTQKPAVAIGLTASELKNPGEGRGTLLLARRSYHYCASHGEAKFAALLQKAAQ